MDDSTPDPIMQIASGFMAAKFLFAANEFSFFDALKDSPVGLAGLAARTGLPRMIVREDGTLATLSNQIGRVALGKTRTRRRHGLLSGRRPRFLVRRKTGSLPVRPLIHRGENEIVGGALS